MSSEFASFFFPTDKQDLAAEQSVLAATETLRHHLQCLNMTDTRLDRNEHRHIVEIVVQLAALKLARNPKLLSERQESTGQSVASLLSDVRRRAQFLQVVYDPDSEIEVLESYFPDRPSKIGKYMYKRSMKKTNGRFHGDTDTFGNYHISVLMLTKSTSTLVHELTHIAQYLLQDGTFNELKSNHDRLYFRRKRAAQLLYSVGLGTSFGFIYRSGDLLLAKNYEEMSANLQTLTVLAGCAITSLVAGVVGFILATRSGKKYLNDPHEVEANAIAKEFSPQPPQTTVPMSITIN